MTFRSSCQYTHGVARRLLGPHDTLPCVLIIIIITIIIIVILLLKDMDTNWGVGIKLNYRL